MRIRHKVLLAIACIVAALSCAVSQTSHQEANTNAHTLEQWVEMLGQPQNPTGQANATRAIQYLGTNAIPSLVQWLAYDPGPSAEHPPQPWWAYPNAYGDPWQIALASGAVEAFRILGSTAAPALPGLSNIVVVSHSKHSSPRAIQAMGYIRPAALSYLITILTNATPMDRGSAAMAIAGWGINARPAVPALLLCLTNSGPGECAFKSLAYLNIEPQLVVPAFTNIATDPAVRETAIRMLGSLGENARAALPTITAALTDTNKYVRNSATNTLLRIAPEILTNPPSH